MEESTNTISEEYGIEGHENRPDYMNERLFQRNRLPPRAYFLPAEQLSLSGKWRFRYASSPLDAEPDLFDDGAWDLIDVPGKLISSLLVSQLREQKPRNDGCHQYCREGLLVTNRSIKSSSSLCLSLNLYERYYRVRKEQ